MIKRRFCSNDNKALIWNSLLNENVFDSLDDKYIPIIISNIDAKIYEIANNTIIDNTNILQLNKEIVYFIYNKMSMLTLDKTIEGRPHCVKSTCIYCKKYLDSNINIKIGDYYVDTAAQKIYGPKNNNGWPDPINY